MISADGALIGALTAYAASCIAGYVFVRVFLRPGPMAFFLAPGAGLALSSAALFAVLLTFGKPEPLPVFFFHAIFLIFSSFVFLAGARRPAAGGERIAVWPDKQRVGSRPVAVVVVLAFAAVTLVLLKSPFGGGLDAWAIWKLKARFIYEAADWRVIFSPELDFSHPDYPVLYPLAIVWGWLGAGRETAFAPAFLAVLFTVSLCGLLAAAASHRGARASLLLGLWAVSVPHLIAVGASQYADIVLAYFAAASVVLLDRAFREGESGAAFLGGFFAGTSAFVKNEGLLFVLAFGAALLFAAAFSSKRRTAAWAAAGILPFLALTAVFKFAVSYPDHMLAGEAIRRHFVSGELGSRFLVIVRHLGAEVLRENAWVYAWFLIAAASVLPGRGRAAKEGFWAVVLLLLWNGGYLGVYLVTALPLDMHLATSLDRVMLHSFPVFLYCAALRGDFC